MPNKPPGEDRMTWQPIETAPDMERVFVAGWQRQTSKCAGYWWWHEDVVVDGGATEHPNATLWHPINFVPFPSSSGEAAK